MSPSEIAAWWGASVATLVLVWDVFKWQSAGPKVKVTITVDMKKLYPNSPMNEQVLVFVEATNTGDRTTTLTGLQIVCFSNPFSKIMGKYYSRSFVPLPGSAPTFPFELTPGKRWAGTVDQSDIKTVFKSGRAFVAVHHTANTRPTLARILLPPSS